MNWLYPRKKLVQACALALSASGIICYGPQLLAATAAGTQIKNLATVTYEDAAGNVYSAQSNEAIVTVAQVYSATVGVDNDTTAAAGQLVYLPYVLTNTGNGSDTFDLTAINGITGGDNIDSANVIIYNDTNGNGVPDAGELPITSITLPANVGNLANLVVAVEVPAIATAGQTLGVTLTADAQQGTGTAVTASVTDLSTGGGRDGLDSTNESLITVTGDAVLVTTKSSVHDVANSQIAYTITVRNNGNQAATDVVIFDGLPENTTLVSAGVSGLLATNGDTLDTAAVLDESVLTLDLNADGDTADADEATLGIDLNTDGDSTDTAVAGIYAIDAELPSQASVTLTFTISYDPSVLPGGSIIENVGYAAGDTNGDGVADSLAPSNVRQDIVPSDYGVIITDTGAAAAAGVNDGGDDDANSTNDDQFVDQISTGGTVLFTNVITNAGNSDDIFELSVNPGNFPVGTVFTFFDDSGVVQLTDTNGSGVDSGVIASAASKTIIVKATLPATASGDAPAPATEYEAIVTATSANDPAAAPVSDTVANSLGTIIVAGADIHNAANGALTTNEDLLAAPYASVFSATGTVGTTVNIPLFIDNESGGSDSYVLTTGSSWDGATLGALPAGWTVEFFEADALGAPVGAPVTSTPVLPAGQLDYPMVAVVSIPADAALAVEDAAIDNNGDGAADTLDGNADGDGDYPIFFQIVSPITGATDIVLDTVDVDSTRQLSLVTPGSNQVEAGGTAAYGHTLANNGNVTEVVEIEATNSQTAWSSTVSIDTDGDGVTDTVLGNLVPGSIAVLQPNGVSIVVEVTDVDGDGVPEFTLEPGEIVPLEATVFAPANASPGETDVLTISATNIDPLVNAPSVSVTDQTTVISGQVRLTKSVAVDANCDGDVVDVGDSTFEAVQSTGVEPGQCAIWRVVAENQGTTQANNVTINDAIPAYSAYELGTLEYCLANACIPASVTDDPADDAGNIIGTNIVFYVGTGANPAAGEGGVLVAGEQATAQFSVRVQ